MKIEEINRIFMESANKFGYNKIDENSIVLNRDKHPFLVFSPVQKNLYKFNGNIIDSEFILQHCMRNIPFKEIQSNPLATQYQLLYSAFNYNYVDVDKIFDLVEDFLCSHLKFNSENIFVMYSEDNVCLENVLDDYKFNKIPYDKQRLVCDIPNFDSYYVKILYYYKKGLVPVSNLVLIDQKDNLSKIDSIFYTERLKFIIENKDNIYYTDLYYNIINFLNDRYNSDFSINCAIVSYFRSILILYNNDVIASNKNIGYTLKHMERELFSNMIVNDITVDLNDINMIFNSIVKNFDLKITEHKILYFSKLMFDNYKKYYVNIKRNKKEALKLIKTMGVTNEFIKLCLDRYGINKLILKKILIKENHIFDFDLFQEENRQYPYYFDIKMNNILDPFDWAKQRVKTKFYKK